MVKYFIAIPVWGKEFVNTFLEYSLPTLMADGNLPFLISNSAIDVRIYTSKDDADILLAHPLIQELKRKATVTIVELHMPQQSHYETSHAYRQAIYALKSNAYKDNIHLANACQEHTGVIVSLNADIIFSDQFFAQAHQILHSDKKVIEVVGPRSKEIEMKRDLQSIINQNTGVLEIQASKLLDLWNKHIHPLLAIHNWEGQSEIFNASHLMWPVGTSGWVARCFFLYPIIVVAPGREFNFAGTIDHSMVTNCGYTVNDVHVVTDNSTMFCCELSEAQKFVGFFGKRNDYSLTSNLYLKHGTNYNFGLLQHTIYLGQAFDSNELEQAQAKSDHVVNNLSNYSRLRTILQYNMRVIGKKIRSCLYEDSQLSESLAKTI